MRDPGEGDDRVFILAESWPSHLILINSLFYAFSLIICYLKTEQGLCILFQKKQKKSKRKKATDAPVY